MSTRRRRSRRPQLALRTARREGGASRHAVRWEEVGHELPWQGTHAAVVTHGQGGEMEGTHAAVVTHGQGGEMETESLDGDPPPKRHKTRL